MRIHSCELSRKDTCDSCQKEKNENCASAGSCNIKTSKVRSSSFVNFVTDHVVRQVFNQLKVLKFGDGYFFRLYLSVSNDGIVHCLEASCLN